MKFTLRSLAVKLFCAWSIIGSIPACAEQPDYPVVHMFEDLIEITIIPQTGWMLELRKDGSGSLSFGSNPTDFAVIPKGSLDVRKFYDCVVPTLRSKPRATKSFPVTLRKLGEVSVNALYTDNESAVIEILLAAKSHAKAFDQGRFEQLLRERPLLPTVR